MKSFSAVTIGWLALTGFAAQSPVRQVYRATFDYSYASLRGDVTRRERVVGTLTEDRMAATSRWSAVTVSTAQQLNPFGTGEPRAFMEGFSYPSGAPGMTTDAFFRGIPASATQERNLVWDTQMFEIFGLKELDRLKLGDTYHFQPASDVSLAGAGTFTNRDVQLTLIGTTTRNGRLCAVVGYQAFFNRVQLQLPALTMTGRSHYWGQIWVALPAKELEHATLFEDVLGEVTQGPQPAQPVSVFRSGMLERVQ